MANYTTFNEIIDVLKDISARHYQLNTFFVGKDFDLENNADIVYPMFQVYPTLAKMPQSHGEYQTIQITLKCKVIDLVQQSDNNLNDVHSDTLQIAQDIINQINQHPFYQMSGVQILGDINLENLEEFEDDYGAGWAFDISLQLRNNQAFCGAPIDPKQGWSFNGPVATGYTYTSSLTCEDLIGCPVIINIQNQIDNLTGGTGGGGSLQDAINVDSRISGLLAQSNSTLNYISLDDSSLIANFGPFKTIYIDNGELSLYSRYGGINLYDNSTEFQQTYQNRFDAPDNIFNQETADRITYLNSSKALKTINLGTGLLFSGGTLSITGGTSGAYLPLSGGTVSGLTSFTNGLLTNTFTATSITLLDTTVLTASTGTLKLGSFNQQGFSVPHYYDTQGNSIEISRDNMLICRNDSGSAMTKGQVVYISGATGTVPKVILAKANSLNTLQIIGILYENISNNAFGRVMTIGNIENINMSAYNSGDLLYVSPTTAGVLTSIKPSYPNYIQQVGVVINNGIGNGVLGVYVRGVQGIYNGDNITASTISITSGATNGYILTSDANGLASWQPSPSTVVTELPPVISQISTLPTGSTIGDRYLLTSGININKVAEWNGSTWDYTTPILDNTLYITNILTTLRYNGSAWVAYQGTAILQNGNTLGSDLILGTNDSKNLIFKTNNVNRISINSGGTATFNISPLAPTPASNDNTTKLATTAFVQNSLGALNAPSKLFNYYNFS